MVMTDASEWIDILVLGTGKPAGSKVSVPVKRKDGSYATKPTGAPITRVIDASKGAAPWKQEVRKAAREVYAGLLLDEALEVCITFVKVRPKCHFHWSNKRWGELRADAPVYPTGKPDLLKLARAVEDALTGIVYRDDSATCKLVLAKVWGEPACAMIRLHAVKRGEIEYALPDSHTLQGQVRLMPGIGREQLDGARAEISRETENVCALFDAMDDRQ
jgi:Holliday junction resolvase RusA-like endonuclease